MRKQGTSSKLGGHALGSPPDLPAVLIASRAQLPKASGGRLAAGINFTREAPGTKKGSYRGLAEEGIVVKM